MIRKAWEKPITVKDDDLRRQWRQEQHRCACCWRPFNAPGSHLQAHHLVKLKRSDEPCNLLALCFCWGENACRCHDLAEGHAIRRGDGFLWPKLSFANCLWLKREANPDEYDAGRLEALLHRHVPEPEKPHEMLLAERTRYR